MIFQWKDEVERVRGQIFFEYVCLMNPEECRKRAPLLLNNDSDRKFYDEGGGDPASSVFLVVILN